MKLYVVATIVRLGENDLFGDIILITPDKRHARTTMNQVKGHKPLPGLDYELLQAYEDVIYFERKLDQVIQNVTEEIEEEVA